MMMRGVKGREHIVQRSAMVSMLAYFAPNLFITPFVGFSLLSVLCEGDTRDNTVFFGKWLRRYILSKSYSIGSTDIVLQ